MTIRDRWADSVEASKGAAVLSSLCKARNAMIGSIPPKAARACLARKASDCRLTSWAEPQRRSIVVCRGFPENPGLSLSKPVAAVIQETWRSVSLKSSQVLRLLDDPAREGSGFNLTRLALFAHSLLGSYVLNKTLNP